MDELEIDGKKYLSSKRAAREHKYHIDYIGQLIRAGKVVGKKVGRSWYVEEASLKSYLLAEAGAPAAPSAPAIEPAFQQAPAETPAAPEPAYRAPVEQEPLPAAHQEIIEEQKREAPAPSAFQISEATLERVVHFSKPAPVPVQQKPASTLTYIEDNEPMLPVLKRANADFIAVPLRKIASETERSQEPESEESDEASVREENIVVTEAPTKAKRNFVFRAQVLAAIAVAVFALVAVASSMLAASIKVTDGGTARVGFTIK
ncbi:MAG TPA: hypothetical protein VN701_02345 [Candidatus Paceibacterota bacterium]|nr:hypothetical protein [Candidatus Paceibacterota bacterium]